MNDKYVKFTCEDCGAFECECANGEPDAGYKAAVIRWRNIARRAAETKEYTTDPEGIKYLEAKFSCYFNCANELEKLIKENLDVQGK